jgi:hypothetical protein
MAGRDAEVPAVERLVGTAVAHAGYSRWTDRLQAVREQEW